MLVLLVNQALITFSTLPCFGQSHMNNLFDDLLELMLPHLGNLRVKKDPEMAWWIQKKREFFGVQ